MVNHYSKFLRCPAQEGGSVGMDRGTPNLIKHALTTTTVLAHFDPDVPIGLACDASAVGIGAVIYHKYEDGTERPIAYAS